MDIPWFDLDFWEWVVEIEWYTYWKATYFVMAAMFLKAGLLCLGLYSLYISSGPLLLLCTVFHPITFALHLASSAIAFVGDLYIRGRGEWSSQGGIARGIHKPCLPLGYRPQGFENSQTNNGICGVLRCWWWWWFLQSTQTHPGSVQRANHRQRVAKRLWTTDGYLAWSVDMYFDRHLHFSLPCRHLLACCLYKATEQHGWRIPRPELWLTFWNIYFE